MATSMIDPICEDKIVYLFMTDKQSDSILNNFKCIQNSMEPPGKTCILFHQKKDDIGEDLKRYSPFLFTNQSLLDLHYTPITMNIVPGSNHFPVLQFFLTFPDYRYYWVIEDDVYFNGEWKFFFDFFNKYDHDFISSHIRTFTQEPEWTWWRSLYHRRKIVSIDKRIASFNPIYRISGIALRFIHDALSNKWVGHHEVLLPTLLHNNGYKILDFGGRGTFVEKGNEDKFYTGSTPSFTDTLNDSTMRFRPVWTVPGNEKDKLYHPVKAGGPS